MGIVKLFQSRLQPADRFEQLVTPYINALYHFAFRLCQSTDDAEELVQLLLTRLFPKCDELEKLVSLRPWLMRSLYNLYVDTYRKQQRTLAVISPEEIPENSRSNDKTPYDHAELSHNQQVMVTAMQTLNEDQRIVVLLHDAEGYTLKELADILQTPEGTLKSRLHRARDRLRQNTEMELFDEQRRDSSKEESI